MEPPTRQEKRDHLSDMYSEKIYGVDHDVRLEYRERAGSQRLPLEADCHIQAGASSTVLGRQPHRSQEYHLCASCPSYLTVGVKRDVERASSPAVVILIQIDHAVHAKKLLPEIPVMKREEDFA